MELVRSGSSWSGRERNCVFLNCPDQSNGDVGDATSPTARFANAAFVTGLDFPDDGRAIAVVDWDHDGDQDIWLRNRTAPRLRLLRNRHRELNPLDDSVCFHLVGTSCNRDAIGSIVEVDFSDARQSRLIGSVTAGDTFLSQSSKWIHFGLGSNSAPIKQVRVQWPGGVEEAFAGVNEGGRYTLVQGTGWAKQEHRQPIDLEAGDLSLPARTAAARVILPGKIPFPDLELAPSAPGTKPTIGNDALLITLWSSSCPNCRAELKTFSESKDAFQNANLNVLAVSLDQINDQANTNVADFLHEVEFPYQTAVATRDTVQLVQDLQRSIFDMYPDTVVPISFLLNSQHYLVAIYRGIVQPEVLLNDVRLATANTATLRNSAVPFEGSWFTNPATKSEIIEIVGKRLFQRNPELGLRFYEQAMNAASDPGRKQKLTQVLMRTHVSLARAASSLNDVDVASSHFDAAIRYMPKSAALHHEFGTLMVKHQRLDIAEHHFREALRLRPDSVTARHSLESLLEIKENVSPSNSR